MRTADVNPATAGTRPAVSAVRATRLASGLIVATYVTAHLANHALGIFSIDAQEALLDILQPVWQSALGTLVLYGALLVHAGLGLYALWRRKTLRMPAWELAQLALGLVIPLLLIPHVFGTRVSQALVGTDATYHAVVAGIWDSPFAMLRQPLLVVIVWTHWLIGLHYWMRLRPGYRRSLPVLYPLAVMLPVLALLGFWAAGFELRAAASESSASVPAAPAHDPTAIARRETGEALALAIYAGLLAAVLAGRQLRRVATTRRRGTYRIHHASGRVVTAPIGHTLLEALREADIPHASVCGGRARCTTCRVRVTQGARWLPAPAALESSALARIGAGKDVRLACQLRPTRNLHVTPLLPPHVGPAEVDRSRTPGHERAVAVMFIDVRESSRLGEQRLPYDVFFILNRFFAEMAEAIRETGGYYSTFNGDGLMALYGTSTTLAQGCRDAMRGAIAIETRLARMNDALADDLVEPLRAGISIHSGEAIVGTMGPPATPILSALGDTVNVAARLESETKRRGCMLVISSACAKAAGVDLRSFPSHT
ncbi:MAG: adenylate/guanylate cyclase domain-containing protein, partial [Rudaea sp.]